MEKEGLKLGNSKIIESFKDKKILVIGDLMLDHYIYGNVKRISPEAPIPILKVEKEIFVPGGAANTSINSSSLGSKTFLAGIIGDDFKGKLLIQELNKKNIDCSCVIKDENIPTIIKKRYIGSSQHLLRVDKEIVKSNLENEKKILEKISKIINQIDAVIFSDYAKGFLSSSFVRSMVNLAKNFGKPIIADIKPINKNSFIGVDFLTPNFNEACEIAGMRGKNENDFVEELCKKINSEFNSNIILTRGEKGMSVFSKSEGIVHIPTKALEVYDVTGAGDTVIASFTLGILSGLSLFESAKIANYAAGIVVGKVGTACVYPEELGNLFGTNINALLNESIRVKQDIIKEQTIEIGKIIEILVNVYEKRNKVLIFGNGGSAADAQHFAAELVGRFKIERAGLAAIALTTDTSILTAIANDYGFENIFSRQIQALVNPGDVVIGLTTSGNSPNVLKAIKTAKELGAKTIGFTGKDGGKLKEISDVTIFVPSENTPRIQEVHGTTIHVLCELLENELKKRAEEKLLGGKSEARLPMLYGTPEQKLEQLKGYGGERIEEIRKEIMKEIF